jgi:transporter family protein
MAQLFQHWQAFAVGSAFFAALTAIFAKIGVSEINSDLATFIRTVVIVVVTALLVTMRREWKLPEEITISALCFLVLSGIGTALSWLCYFRALQLGPASQVAPIDKLSVVLVVILSAVFLGEQPSKPGSRVDRRRRSAGQHSDRPIKPCPSERNPGHWSEAPAYRRHGR